MSEEIQNTIKVGRKWKGEPTTWLCSVLLTWDFQDRLPRGKLFDQFRSTDPDESYRLIADYVRQHVK